MSLELSSLYITIGGKVPSIEDLEDIDEGHVHDLSDSVAYQIYTEIVENKYFWLHARYGRPLPRSKIVINTKTETEESNPRDAYQIEPDKELFGLYHAEACVLYLSNTRQKSWFEKYLNRKLKQGVVIKNIFKDPEDFVRHLAKVNKVKLIVTRDLLSQQAKIMEIFPNHKDMYGLGEPEDFTLEANFKNARLTDKFVACFMQMVRWKQESEVKSLTCIGEDDQNFESVFNVDTFTQKVIVEVAKDEDGFHDPNEVKQKLIERIEE